MHPRPTQQTLFLSLETELTEESLLRQTGPIDETLRSTPLDFRLLIDASQMTGYTSEARNAFVEWHRSHKARCARVAIVTDRKLWHMVIRAMGVASGQPMHPFTDRASAESWLLESTADTA
jgi:hypothetical protein